MEKLLEKDATFYWDDDFQKSLDVLKEKMVIASILVFPKWKKEFHVHVDASCIDLGVVLAKPREGDIYQPITFASCKLSKVERNYSMMERKACIWCMHCRSSGITYWMHISRCLGTISR